jgi:chemotaxis protein MotB
MSAMSIEGGSGVMGGSDMEKVEVLEERVHQLGNIGQSHTKIVNQEMLEDFFFPESGLGRDEMAEQFSSIFTISETKQGVVITLGERILFNPGEAEIKPTTYRILDLIATVLGGVSNDILIMGHTDSEPSRNKGYSSNWELSLYRALNVHHYLAKKSGLSPERFGVGGYGDLRPIYPNNTLEGREKNRRVEIILKRT